MTDRLLGRRVLITGAMGAFGRATMREFQSRGALVRGIDLRAGRDVDACDITDSDAARQAVTAAVSRLGGLDILVNCAGIGVPVDAGSAPDTSSRSVVDTNLWGQWSVTSAALPALTRSRGRVIFVASALARVNLPFATAYAVSKRALTAYADTLRMEYGSHIKVSTIYPGYVATDIHRASHEAGVDIGAIARAEGVPDVVATIIDCAKRRRPPRDRGTTLIGHAQTMAATWFPATIDRVIQRRVRRQFNGGRYRAAPVAQGMIHRHFQRSTRHGDPVRPGQSRSVTVSDGTRLRLSIHDPGDATVSVVYLHGWCLSSRIYQYQATAMTDTGTRARLINVDLRGHGASQQPAPDRLTIPRLADDVAEILGELCADTPVILVGHSMGGMTVMELADRHAELFTAKVAGVVLVNTSADTGGMAGFGWPTTVSRAIRAFVTREFPRRHRAFVRRGHNVIPRRRLDAMLARAILFGKPVERENLQVGRELIATTHPATVDRFWCELRAHDRTAALQRLADVPVRILSGGRDRLTPVSHSRHMAELLPHARLTILPGAGHTIPLERPTELATTVAALVSRLDNENGQPTDIAATGESHEGRPVSDHGGR